MIEILGYITLYLLIGVVLLPYFLLSDNKILELAPFILTRGRVATGVVSWPIVFPVAVVVLWFGGWKELKNYK